jgi:surface polysaccharide O-acyltransferase-like enzyme
VEDAVSAQVATSERAVAPDLVRAVATVLVVQLHTAAMLARHGPGRGVAAFWAGNLYDSLARPSVPLFVMLTGWMLLAPARREESIGRFLWRRLGRVALPLLVWSLIAVGWVAARDHQAVNLTGFPRQLLNGPVFYHLWYVYVLIGLYLVIPILRPLAATTSQTLRWYTLGLWFVWSSILPLWAWWGGPRVAIPVVVVSTYVGYLLAGIWLAGMRVSTRTRLELLLLIVLTTVWTIVATARLTGADTLNPGLYGYEMPNVLVMSVGWFVLLTQAEPAAWVDRHPRLLAVIRVVAASSYGVYLVHPFILNLLDSGFLGVRITGASLPPFLGVPGLALGVLAVSVVLMAGVGRIPVVRRLLGA